MNTENLNTMTNRDLAEKIYKDLNKRGADLGNASIGIICKTLDDNGVKNCYTPNVVKSLPNDEEVKAHIDALPYYGTCTTEYNEGFEDGVKWLKEQMAK